MSTRFRVVIAGAWHHRRTHLGVVLATAIATAVLTGALVVGDAVRGTLRERALERIGGVHLALASGDRFFRAELAVELGTELGTKLGGALAVPAASALALQGVANTPDGVRRIGGVSVLGVDASFFALAPQPFDAAPADGEAWVNAALAERLGLDVGASFALRVAKPSPMPRDLVLAQAEEVSTGLRLRLVRVVDADAFGAFDLSAKPSEAPLVYVARAWLERELELLGRANLLLLGAGREPVSLERARAALRERWRLEDGELFVRSAQRGLRELHSPRVFLDTPVGTAAENLRVPLLAVLTYFVNELRAGERATPYSMVSALGHLGPSAPAPASFATELSRVEPPEQRIAIHPWLAKDLDAREGTQIALRYWAIGADRRLHEATQSFAVSRIVEDSGLAADPGLMPEFPGLHDSEHCKDWEPGAPVNLDKIRDQDEQWWEERKGTPKAFLALATGRELWASRFGDLTALRWDPAVVPDFEARLRDALDPAALGLVLTNAREGALVSGSATTDLGGLFLGLSFFLIASALLLVAMLFGFGVEQRASEIGTYLALGFPRPLVVRLFLGEGALLALVGVALGTLGALLYGDVVLGALGGAWSGAVGDAALRVQWNPTTLLLGAGVSFLAALLPIARVLRRMLRNDTLDLLRAEIGAPVAGATSRAVRRTRIWIAFWFLLALAAFGYAVAQLSGATPSALSGAALAGLLFGAGFALLLALLGAWRRALLRSAEPVAGGSVRSVAQLAWRNAARRPGRSLGIAALLASGSFLVLAIEAYRQAPPRDPALRASGTGGFQLYAESTLPIFADLTTQEGRALAQLDETLFANAELLPLRVRDGDEASCLSLAAPREPRLLGVESEKLAARGSFERADALDLAEGTSPWTLLTRDLGAGVVPAIGDAASVAWSLHKKLGEGIEYLDERGQTFEVRIVATLRDSMLQGALLIDAARFRERFPSISGARQFLIAVPASTAPALTRELEQSFADLGLRVTTSTERLAAFQRVQNTYLQVFQMLGFLGLVLGSLGLGLVVLRNVLERRAELALLRALGWRTREVRRVLLFEHALLVGAGMAIGGLASLAPALASIGQGASFATAALLFAAGTANAFLWVALGAFVAARTPVLDALRS